MCRVCCFIGHRRINYTQELQLKINSIIEDLIVNKNVGIFLFGSKSDFNNYCHRSVTMLKEKYKLITRVSYTCRNETCVLESEREKKEKIYSKFLNEELLCVEREFEHNTKYSSGRAIYIERNFAMIDNSDYCVFYYDENYLPDMRKISKKCFECYQPKSGTALAYTYAQRKKKIIINICNYFN